MGCVCVGGGGGVGCVCGGGGVGCVCGGGGGGGVGGGGGRGGVGGGGEGEVLMLTCILFLVVTSLSTSLQLTNSGVSSPFLC